MILIEGIVKVEFRRELFSKISRWTGNAQYAVLPKRCSDLSEGRVRLRKRLLEAAAQGYYLTKKSYGGEGGTRCLGQSNF